nr:MAG TPA: hypothetical protein [Caudoviricetes sp.]
MPNFPPRVPVKKIKHFRQGISILLFGGMLYVLAFIGLFSKFMWLFK